MFGNTQKRESFHIKINDQPYRNHTCNGILVFEHIVMNMLHTIYR